MNTFSNIRKVIYAAYDSSLMSELSIKISFYSLRRSELETTQHLERSY